MQALRKSVVQRYGEYNIMVRSPPKTYHLCYFESLLEKHPLYNSIYAIYNASDKSSITLIVKKKSRYSYDIVTIFRTAKLNFKVNYKNDLYSLTNYKDTYEVVDLLLNQIIGDK